MQLFAGDIEVGTTEYAAAHIDSSCCTQQVREFHTSKAIQVAENDPILNKATKLDHLCTEDRDYFLLETDTITADEYAKLSLGSETTTDDSHVQQLSLPHCDDSLSTTFSEESDCTVAVRVYDLNKRETKILRHDIIKRSRNPIGGVDLINTPSALNNLGNCCSDTSLSVLNNTSEIDQSNQTIANHNNNSQCIESANEARKPPRSPTSKLRSVHLNRNPRKLKMSDVQLMNDAFGTSLDPKIVEELKRKNDGETQVDNSHGIDAPVNNSAVIVSTTESLLHSERNVSDVHVDLPEKEANITQPDDQGATAEAVSEEVAVVVVAVTPPVEFDDNKPAHVVNESASQSDELNDSTAENSCANNTNSNNNSDATANAITTTTISTAESTKTSETNATIISETNNNNSTNENIPSIVEDSEAMPMPAVETNTIVDKSETLVGTITHEQKLSSSPPASPASNQQVKTFERSYEVIVQVNEHKEKSVIEEDVIPALPSVRELARSFSTKRDSDARPEKLQRPKVSGYQSILYIFC